jgi:tRNA (guanine-N7-)-methyltransferase
VNLRSEGSPLEALPEHLRRVRSFVRREGRLTDAQARALENLWPLYGIESGAEAQPGNPDSWFGRSAPLVVEIGFGSGSALLHRAALAPERNFLGIEVHRPGVGGLLRGVRDAGLENVRVSDADAVVFIEDRLPPQSVSEFIIEFPDPWPKKRHHKRRLVQPALVALLVSRLLPGGLLRLATDWAPYAEHMTEVLKAMPSLENMAVEGDYIPRPESRPLTRFEARGLRLGHEVFDLAYRRTDHVG